MSSGYSVRLRDLNMKADERKIGVRLGRLCIEHDVPVKVVAEAMGVSRAAVYNWFSGSSAPSFTAASLVEQYIAKLS